MGVPVKNTTLQSIASIKYSYNFTDKLVFFRDFNLFTILLTKLCASSMITTRWSKGFERPCSASASCSNLVRWSNRIPLYLKKRYFCIIISFICLSSNCC